MKLDPILDKWHYGDHITDDELVFAIEKLDAAMAVFAELGARYSASRFYTAHVLDSMRSTKHHREWAQNGK
jgi:hypothetical protein